MNPIGFHLNFHLHSRRVLAPDTVTQRRLARAILRAARPFALLAFRISDTHGHAVVVGNRRDAGELARRMLIAVQRLVGGGERFAPTWFEPITSQQHLVRAFRYVLRQDRHHGFQHDPLHECSNLPDLLGLRTAGNWTAEPVRRHLPRVGRAELLRLAGVEELMEEGGPLAELRDAAAATIGRGDLVGLHAEVVAARTAAAHVGLARASTGDVARLLGAAPRTIRRLAHCTADPTLVRAIGLQLDLRGALRSSDEREAG